MNGHCLCGAVSFTSPNAREIGACHCGFCRRWGGGPLLAVHCGSNVQFSGTDQITTYASSDWAERAFCKQCGTHLYYKFLATGEYFVPAGAFDSTDFNLASQIYVDKKPAYYSFANQTPMLTEQQVIEQYTPPNDYATWFASANVCLGSKTAFPRCRARLGVDVDDGLTIHNKKGKMNEGKAEDWRE